MKKAFYIFIVTLVGLLSLTSVTSDFDEVSECDYIDEIDIVYSDLTQSCDEGVYFKLKRRTIVSKNANNTTSYRSLKNINLSIPFVPKAINISQKNFNVVLWEHDVISYQHRFQLF